MKSLLLALTVIAAQPPVSADAAPENEPAKGVLPVPDYSGDLAQRPALSGNWNGIRDDLAATGVQADIDWTQYVQGVVNGGANRTTMYGGHLDYLVKLDLMKMGVMPGAIVTIRGESLYGNSVNGDIGTILPVNATAAFPLTDDLDDDVLIAITELNYTQFLTPKFAVVAGKLQTLDADANEFASGRGKTQFMDANFIFNSVVGLRLPYSTLGVGALWLPDENISINASLVNTVDSSTTSGFDDFGDGLTLAVEADVQYRLSDLPGGVNVGGLYSFNQDFSEFGGKLIVRPGEGLSVPTEDDTWALYWSAWQYLFVEDPNERPVRVADGVADHQGWGLFARFGIADDDTNPVEWSVSVGIGGRGVIPGRDNDTFGVGYYYTSLQTSQLTDFLSLGDAVQGGEAYYDVAILPSAHLTFDAQVQDPVSDDVDAAIILGARLNISF